MTWLEWFYIWYVAGWIALAIDLVESKMLNMGTIIFMPLFGGLALLAMIHEYEIFFKFFELVGKFLDWNIIDLRKKK